MIIEMLALQPMVLLFALYLSLWFLLLGSSLWLVQPLVCPLVYSLLKYNLLVLTNCINFVLYFLVIALGITNKYLIFHGGLS